MSLLQVDWSLLPQPVDDGACDHLRGLVLPSVPLRSTSGDSTDLASLPGRTVVFAYPRTGVPGQISIVEDWDAIPGARGCTPHACGFRDLFSELQEAGVSRVFGLSTQSTAYQAEAVARLHLPFPILSDEDLALTLSIKLPIMTIGGLSLIARCAFVVDGGRIVHVFYPVFPPDRNASDVLAWVRANPAPSPV